MEQQIKITAEPKETRGQCVFTVDRPIYADSSVYFATEASAKGSPLAEQIFALADVTGVLVSHDVVTVSRRGQGDWVPLARQVGAIIRSCLQAGTPAISPNVKKSMPSEAIIREKVKKVFDAEINPMVAMHGGFIELIDVRGNDIFIHMGGGCQGCGSANVTLKQGVEVAVRQHVPEVGAIIDTTDHAAGRNPYFAPKHHH